MKFVLVAFCCCLAPLAFMAGRPLGTAKTPALITVVKIPPAAGHNRNYVSNREPLAPSPLIKLPIGAIEPKGWLLSQLQLMRDGFTGRLKELSSFLGSGSGWLTLKNKGWEEMPYWLKGYGDLGYVLKDAALIGEAKGWIDEALGSQQPDGYFGPPDNKKNLDLWPNMLLSDANRRSFGGCHAHSHGVREAAHFRFPDRKIESNTEGIRFPDRCLFWGGLKNPEKSS